MREETGKAHDKDFRFYKIGVLIPDSPGLCASVRALSFPSLLQLQDVASLDDDDVTPLIYRRSTETKVGVE